MSVYKQHSIQTLQDICRFENEATFEQRVSARSVYDLFVEAATRHPERIALTMIMTGADDEVARRMPYSELLEGVTRTANLFTALGGPRPGVAYMLPNLIETQLTLWGAETAGYAVPINFLMQAEHIAELIAASGARVLVALGPHPVLDIWEKAARIKQLLPDIVLVQVAPSDAPPMPDVVRFATAVMQHPGDALSFGYAGRDDDVAAYFHTGGTTGTPKLVAHTHRNQIVAAFGGAVLLDLSGQDVMTNGLPMFHVAACIAGSLSFFTCGANVLILSPAGMRNPKMIQGFWKMVERYRATIIGCVPTALGAILEVPLDGDLSSVRFGIVGAAATPRSVAERFEQVTGKTLHEILGMTEGAGLVAIAPAHATPVIGSVGFRLPYTEVSVRQLTAEGALGATCAPNEIGILTVRGPTVSPGYIDAQRNDGVFVDGYLNSGDLAYADEQGRIFIAGRAKDLIIRSGHNIDPLTIEDALLAHPAVSLAAAVGQPDRYAGELPVCYVTLRPNMEVTADDLRAFAEPLIAERPAWPKQIFVVDAIPLTNVGKIYKPQLRCDAVSRLISQEINDILGAPAAIVEVASGGKRGMEVTVTLPATHAGERQRVEAALEGYLFEYKVVVA